MIVWLFIFGALFYLFNELEDESVRNRWTKWTHFLNTSKSWKNKWALDSSGKVMGTSRKWYYFGILPPHKERFPYSSTALVFLTDGEHLFQFLKKRAIDAGFLIVDWRYFVAWEVGTLVMGIIKEKFLKQIQ